MVDVTTQIPAQTPIISKGSTSPFSAFEWMIAGRYLRSRRKETFISIIAGFSFIGIMLGVATLIIVMAVMNGFRAELLDRILGVNGHMIVQPIDGELVDYKSISDRINNLEGVRYAISLVEGQALVSGGIGGSGALVRGISEADLRKIKVVSDNIKFGTLDGFDTGEGVAVGRGFADVEVIGTPTRARSFKVKACPGTRKEIGRAHV